MGNLGKSTIGKLLDGITSEEEISSRNRRLCALLFTVGAFVLGCTLYTRSPSEEFWQIMLYPFISIEPTKLTFQMPGLLHGFFGLLLCAPLYIRNIIPFKAQALYYYLTLVLNLFFFAAIAQLVMGLKFTFAYNLANTIIIVALVLTWLGMRAIAGFAWIAIFCLVVYNLANADMHLKNLGLLFLTCAFLSLIFQSDLTPGNLFRTFKAEFKGIAQSPRLDAVKESMNKATKTSRKLVTGGIGVAQKT